MAKKFKLIVNSPLGFQEVQQVYESGYYFDETLVVYDERKKGELTAEQLSKVGGYTNAAGEDLVFSQAALDINDAKLKVISDADDAQVLKQANGLIKANDKGNAPHDRIDGILEHLGLL